jgi:hypothetical protein
VECEWREGVGVDVGKGRGGNNREEEDWVKEGTTGNGDPRQASKCGQVNEQIVEGQACDWVA